MTREHSRHVTCSIGRASRYGREGKPDAIGLDASMRQPGCSNGGRQEDSTKTAAHPRFTLTFSYAPHILTSVTRGRTMLFTPAPLLVRDSRARCLAIACLPYRLPRRLLRCVPRRPLPCRAGRTHSRVPHPCHVERRAPASVVVLRQLRECPNAESFDTSRLFAAGLAILCHTRMFRKLLRKV